MKIKDNLATLRIKERQLLGVAEPIVCVAELPAGMVMDRLLQEQCRLQALGRSERPIDLPNGISMQPSYPDRMANARDLELFGQIGGMIMVHEAEAYLRDKAHEA